MKLVFQIMEKMFMKTKMCLILTVGIILIGLFSQILIQTCTAESAKLSIYTKTFEVSKTVVLAGRTIVYYNISIIMYNSGDEISQNTTVRIIDEDGSIGNRYNTIAPDEYKEFIIDNWGLLGTGTHQINISYFPTDEKVPVSGDNSGNDAILVSSSGGTPDQKPTPGFEIVILLGAILFISLIKRKRKI